MAKRDAIAQCDSFHHAKGGYRAVQIALAESIARGEIALGAALPSRPTLSEHHHVSYGTIDRAVRELAKAGIVRAENGRGTYVQRIPDLAEVMEMSGVKPAGQKAASHELHRVGLHQTATLGVLANFTPDCPMDWDRSLVHSVEAAFGALGGMARLYDRYRPLPASWVSFEDAVQRMLDDKVDAILGLGLNNPLDMADRMIRCVNLREVPTVCITWDRLQAPMPHVYYDSRHCGYVAMEHLLDAGYEHFSFLAPFGVEWELERIKGARQALCQHGRDPDYVHVVSPRTLLQAHRWPDEREAAISESRRVSSDLARTALADGQISRDGSHALIAANDETAYGALMYMESEEIVPGREVGLIGFDDCIESRRKNLSTIGPPVTELCRQAVELLVAALNGQSTTLQVCCNAQVTVRGSTIRESSLNSTHNTDK